MVKVKISIRRIILKVFAIKPATFCFKSELQRNMIALKCVVRCIMQLPSLVSTQTSKLHNLTSIVPRYKMFPSDQLIKPTFLQNSPNKLLERNRNNEVIGCTPTFDLQQVRCKVRVFYSYSAWKRINKFGIEKLLSTQNGRAILWKKFLKGRYNYAAFERFLPSECYGRVLPKHSLHLRKKFVTKKPVAPYY